MTGDLNSRRAYPSGRPGQFAAVSGVTPTSHQSLVPANDAVTFDIAPEETRVPDELIEAVYDAALETTRWSSVLRECRDFVGGMGVALYAKRNAGGLERSICYDDGGIAADFKQTYIEGFVHYDPSTPAELRAPFGQAVSAADVGDHDEYRRTRFYEEWQQPQGVVDFIRAPIVKSGDFTAILCVFRHERDGMVDDGARQRMRLIAPHIRRAIGITGTLDRRAREIETYREALDGLSAGLFFVDARGHILHANRTGSHMLADGTAVVVRQGRLGTVERAASEQLALAAEAAEGGDAQIGTMGISIPLSAVDGSRFAAHVLPLSSGERRRAGLDFGAAAAVFVQRVTLDAPAASQMVAKAFGLTPGEERVLAGVVDVGGVAETAEALGIGEATVKTHLNHIFAKTDTRRQSDLVRLVAAYQTPLAR